MGVFILILLLLAAMAGVLGAVLKATLVIVLSLVLAVILLAWIGALRLARPGSPWDRHRYDPARHEQASGRAARFDSRWYPLLDHVSDIIVVAEGNPRPGLATFHLTPLSGRAEAATRIRLAATQNIVACVNRAGLTVVDTVIEQLAASEAVLTPDEKELGVAIVDIGGGTTDLAIFERGSLWHTGVVGIGGRDDVFAGAEVVQEVACGKRVGEVAFRAKLLEGGHGLIEMSVRH